MPDDTKLATTCRKCGVTVRYPARFAGKNAHFKSCGTALILPEDPFLSDIVDELPANTSHRVSIPAPEEPGFAPVAWGERKPPVTPGTRTKSRLGSALLAFFLGPLGFHRFYLNQTGTGLIILALSLCGFGLIITIPLSLIDCFGFLVMSDEAFAERYS